MAAALTPGERLWVGQVSSLHLGFLHLPSKGLNSSSVTPGLGVRGKVHTVLPSASRRANGGCGGDYRGEYCALEAEGPTSSLSHLDTGLTPTGEGLSLVPQSSKPHGLPDAV